jgi:signal transduction histidine kinase
MEAPRSTVGLSSVPRSVSSPGSQRPTPVEGSTTHAARVVASGEPGPWRRVFSGIATRIFLSYVLLLALSTAASVLFIRQILLVRLDEEIAEGLEQEQQEFRRLVGGLDPRTGEPFGTDFRAIFDVYFDRNVLNEGEEIIAILDGELYLARRDHDAFPLEERSDLIARWAALTDSQAGEIQTEQGIARYLAVPLLRDGVPRGVFVVANFPQFEQAEINAAVRVAVVVSGGVLVVALLLAWTATGRIVGPLRVLTATSRSISETDFSRRIPVHGRDEVAQLATTFNDMLDRLEQAFETQQRFVDDAGHELRTPITIIRGHLELLEADPDQRRETIELLMDELDRMNRIVNDLLVLARAEQPDFLDLEAVDVEPLTHEILAKASALASRRWELERVGRGRVVADRQRITQAVIQLAHNAVNHTQEGEAIAVGSIVADGQARFWVRDTGPGVPYEEQQQIFHRFARGRATARSSQGAGLGLAIVRAIAEAHRGSVELRSRPGAGATFTVLIPTEQQVSEELSGTRA